MEILIDNGRQATDEEWADLMEQMARESGEEDDERNGSRGCIYVSDDPELDYRYEEEDAGSFSPR